MNMIVVADKNWGIGRKNQLLFRLPADMKRFRVTTTGGVVIMGRKTLESFPKAEPLKNRVNIVISRNPDFQKDGVVVCHSIMEAAQAAQDYPDREVFVIGGGSIYQEMLPLCRRIYLTRVDEAAEADTYFPDLDALAEWKLKKREPFFEDNGHRISFCIYERNVK